MKKALFCVCTYLFFFAFSEPMFATSNAGGCKLYNGIAFVTWVTQDNEGSCHVWGATGPISQDPNTWTAQEISIPGVLATNIPTPSLYLDSNTGNVLSIWQYYDTDLAIMRIAAATLPFSAPSWTSHVLSDVTSEISGFGDQNASIDPFGNFMVTWSAYNPTSELYVVRAATGAISGITTTWNPSFILPGAGN